MYERQMHPDKNHINYVCACKVKVYAANVQSVSRTHLSNLINKTAKTEKIMLYRIVVFIADSFCVVCHLP